MTKRKKVNKAVKREKKLYRLFLLTTVFLVIGIIYSRATLSKIKTSSEDNQSLAMKINEMVSLDKIMEVSNKQGLKYNNNNIKSVLE